METVIIKIGKGRGKKGLVAAARALKEGALVAFPTETVYGLGTNAFNAEAVRKIFKAKGRPADNPLIVHIWSKRQVPLVACGITPAAKALIRKFFPGPLSIVLKKSKRIPLEVTGGLDTVCVRMPSMKLARCFLSMCDVPVAAPSANISGKPSPTSWKHVMRDLGGKIPYLLAGPDSSFGLESTVVDCSGKGPRLLRAGSLGLERIEGAVGKVAVPRKLRKALCPGMRYRHYAPKARVIVVGGARDAPAKKRGWAYIGMGVAPRNSSFCFLAKGKTEYARRLFSFLRECDDRGIGAVYAQKTDCKGIGRAINDRLERASFARRNSQPAREA